MISFTDNSNHSTQRGDLTEDANKGNAQHVLEFSTYFFRCVLLGENNRKIRSTLDGVLFGMNLMRKVVAVRLRRGRISEKERNDKNAFLSDVTETDGLARG